MLPIADKLRFLREEKELNQIEVAAELHIKPQTYSSYENGHQPKAETLVMLSQYYGVSLDYLVGISQDRRPQGGRLAEGFTALATAAGDAAITAQTVGDVLEAARAYYRHGAPCGTIPMASINAYLTAMTSCMKAAAQGDFSKLVSDVDAAVVSALQAAKMPTEFLTSQKATHE